MSVASQSVIEARVVPKSTDRRKPGRCSLGEKTTGYNTGTTAAGVRKTQSAISVIMEQLRIGSTGRKEASVGRWSATTTLTEREVRRDGRRYQVGQTHCRDHWRVWMTVRVTR